jgi:hypothetical protein
MTSVSFLQFGVFALQKLQLTIVIPPSLAERKNMSDSDGIQISDRPSWEHTGKELFAILGKRLIALPSKMLGFKPFCLYLATWLLVNVVIVKK